VIRSFGNQGTDDLFNRINSAAARKTCPQTIWSMARRKLDQLNAAVSLGSLDIPPGNRLEALRGKRKGQYSIRINAQYRVCFVWTTEGAEHVEVVDYH
jgi:toxin HigB-1